MSTKRMSAMAIPCLAVIAGVSVGTSTAEASPLHLRWSFTGEDLLSHAYVNGADGSTAVDNDLYEGARLLRDGTSPTSEQAARTYVESEHSTFDNRWNALADSGATFDSFNLWGLDGNGENWGEDYKPTEWLSATGPSDWSTGTHDYEALWGSPPSGTITSEFPFWNAGEGEGMAIDGSEDLSSFEFTVDLLIDEEDAWWDLDTGDAPNSLDELEFTVWFGGMMSTGDMYEGNLVLSGSNVQIIPLPAPVFMGLAGLAGVAYLRRRQSNANA